MPFIKSTTLHAVFFLCLSVFLASCATKEKVEEEPVALTPEQIRIMELVKFGPDPYEASAPVVTPEEKPKMDALKKDFAAAVKLLTTDEAAAEARLKQFNEQYPAYSGAAYNLAVLEKKRGNVQAAKDYLNVAITRNPKNLNARNEMALIYRDEGNFAAAEKEYLGIIKMWGGYLTAYKNIGILYDLYMGRFEDALPYYKKYNSLVAEPDKQVNGWIVDIERRLATQPAAQPTQVPEGQ